MDKQERQDFIKYLKILCAKELVSKQQIKLFKMICIPALEQSDGELNDNMDTYNEVQNCGGTLNGLNRTLTDIYQELNSWMSVKEAAKYMGFSKGYVRRLVRLAKDTVSGLEAQLQKGRYIISMTSINDWLVKNNKVKIA